MSSFTRQWFRMKSPHVSEIRPIADGMAATASPDRTRLRTIHQPNFVAVGLKLSPLSRKL